MHFECELLNVLLQRKLPALEAVERELADSARPLPRADSDRPQRPLVRANSDEVLSLSLCLSLCLSLSFSLSLSL